MHVKTIFQWGNAAELDLLCSLQEVTSLHQGQTLRITNIRTMEFCHGAEVFTKDEESIPDLEWPVFC